jgi:putative ABC transport system permease protein
MAKRILISGIVSIWRHRLRSSLTILGIVFGVCSVIAMLAIGEGASQEAQEQIRKLGSQNIIVNSVKPPEEETVTQQTARVSEYGLTYSDAERVRDTIPSVEVLVPSRTIRADVYYKRKKLDTNLVGTVPWYPEVANARVKRGRFFNGIETRDCANVCALSAEVAERLFILDDPMGKTIRVMGDYFEVIGVMEKGGAFSGEQSSGGNTLDIFIPITAAKARFGDTIMRASAGTRSLERVELHRIIVKVDTLPRVMSTAEVVGSILKRFHKKMDYEIVVPLELLRQAARTKRIFSIVLGSIAAISLLVGGIGIMNIMLASVTERTREIGIRRALGAKKRDIISQFLTETVLLSGSGGVIGVLIGILIPALIEHFSGMRTIIRFWSLGGAFGISILIGMIFGIYPAYRAALMNPIAALRHE